MLGSQNRSVTLANNSFIYGANNLVFENAGKENP
jgi:hypothetical protein